MSKFTTYISSTQRHISVTWTVVTWGPVSPRARAADSLQNSELPPMAEYSLSNLLAMIACSACIQCEIRKPIRIRNKSVVYHQLACLQNGGQNIRFSIIVTISTSAQIDFLRIGVPLKSFGYAQNCIRWSQLNIAEPRSADQRKKTRSWKTSSKWTTSDSQQQINNTQI